MNKRFVCLLLTLIMLIGLVPTTVSAASFSISESAITILKQLEGYVTTCNTNGYTGYGTKCTEDGPHGSHRTNERLADLALREELKALDTAINNFAAKKGVNLTQGKHDALVLFSFENGTAWTTGTGDLQAAVTSGKTGSDFLNAICRWDADTSDDIRRMIEANMYLNGVYSAARPSNYIRVYFDANKMGYQLDDGTEENYVGSINENTVYQYYDVSSSPAPHMTPTMDYHTFSGWYSNTEYGWAKVYTLNASHHEDILVAGWIPTYSEPGTTAVSYVVTKSQLLSERVYYYGAATGKFGAVVGETVDDYCFAEDTLKVDSDYLDEDGVRWCKIAGVSRWVKVVGGTASSGIGIDVNVTVTNSYVRSRAEASIYSAQNGTYHQGDVLRIIATKSKDGFLWGQVAKSATDSTSVGWVALMYTNYESVRNSGSTTTNKGNAVATAVITYNGYVNVRSDAGTHNKIVSALPKGTEVSLYETKFVNGLEWGRCSTGWFCLSYASVERLSENTSYITDAGFTAYAFKGTIDPYSVEIFDAPSTSANRIYTRQLVDADVTVTNFVLAENITWGKIKEGWIQVSDASGNPLSVNLDTAKFVVTAESLAVRSEPNTSASRVDALVKGVEFNVNYSDTNQIVVVGDTIWGYATKVGETGTASYMGWVNLATKYVSRNGAPTVENEDTGSVSEGLMATVINTNALKIRDTDSTYGKILGTLTYGTTMKVWAANDNNTWYRVDSNKNGQFDNEDGWCSGAYLNITESTDSSTGSSGSSSATVETGMGVVANTYAGLNVRSGAGTGYAFVCKLLPGTAVEILEVKTVGATKWGRIAQGWVSMDYIAMISNYPITGTTGGTGNNSGNTTSTEPAIYTGVTKVDDVIVYKETSTDSEAVRILEQNNPVTIHELLTVVVEETKTPGASSDSNTGSSSTTTITKTTSYWARVNDGYIYAPGDNLSLDTLDEDTYTVTESEALNVRNEAGTNGTTILYKLAKGEQVTITDLKIVNGNVWGKVETTDEDGQLITGWASLAYMTKGAIVINNNQNNNNNNNTGNGNTNVGMGNGSSTGGVVDNPNGYRYTGTVIRADEVNVRATPSTAAAKTTTLKKGAALVIYETITADNMAWGRCDAGWIYLYYVDLVPVTGAVDARVVYNDNTVIYTDMNCSGVAGTYARMSVIDIFEIVGKMARTELGWVNTDNLL